MEDFESIARKAVSFVVARDKEVPVWREQTLPKALPGFGGWKKKRSKSKEEENEEESQEIKIRNEATRGIVAGVLKEADAGGGGVTRNTSSATQSNNVEYDST